MIPILYLENRIWKIQNIKWLNRKILTMPIEVGPVSPPMRISVFSSSGCFDVSEPSDAVSDTAADEVSAASGEHAPRSEIMSAKTISKGNVLFIFFSFPSVLLPECLIFMIRQIFEVSVFAVTPSIIPSLPESALTAVPGASMTMQITETPFSPYGTPRRLIMLSP